MDRWPDGSMGLDSQTRRRRITPDRSTLEWGRGRLESYACFAQVSSSPNLPITGALHTVLSTATSSTAPVRTGYVVVDFDIDGRGGGPAKGSRLRYPLGPGLPHRESLLPMRIIPTLLSQADSPPLPTEVSLLPSARLSLRERTSTALHSRACHLTCNVQPLEQWRMCIRYAKSHCVGVVAPLQHLSESCDTVRRL